ncbi:hypothetical protein [Saccharothrix stipae]
MEPPLPNAKFVIVNADIEGPRWREQKEAVKATGAAYDEPHRQWTLWFNLGDPPIDRINALFTLAREYGTIVRLVIDSPSGQADIPPANPYGTHGEC